MKKVQTLCKNCTLFQDGDCKLGRLQIFLDKQQAYKTPQKEFVVDRTCNAFVNKTVHKEDQHKDPKVIRDLLKVKVDMLVFIDKNSKIQNIVNRILSFDLKPHAVHFISQETVNSLELIKICSAQKVFKYDLSYVFQPHSVDNIVHKSTSEFVCYTNDVNKIPLDYLKNLDIELNDKLERLVLVRPFDQINGLMVHNRVFNNLGGNHGESIIEKIEEVAREEQAEYMIREFYEFTNYGNNST